MKLILVVTFLLSGCYMANGSPSSTEYWVKNGKKITYSEISNCDESIYSNLGERFEYLDKKLKYKSSKEYKDEYAEYLAYIKKAKPLVSKCYFDLGYRFSAPYYWCTVEHNMDTCKINQKYR